MAVRYTDFLIKYSNDLAIAGLDEQTFAIFLSDALTEIALIPWGALADRATEMLIGHLVTISKNGAETSVETRRIDGEGTVTYRSGSYSSSWFGVEYERLLKLVRGGTNAIAPTAIPVTGTHLAGDRTDPSPQAW